MVPRTDIPGDDGLTVIFEDITEEIERDRKLERARERMERPLRQTDAVVFEIERATAKVERHGSFLDYFDLPTGEVPTWRDHLERVVHPEDGERFETVYEVLIDGDRREGELDYRTSPAHGDVHWIRDPVSIATVEEGIEALVGVARDITTDKRREQELLEVTQFQEAVILNDNVWIIVLDSDGNVVLWN